MKSKVLSRPMFQKAMDPENVGIMHGFKDSLEDNLKKVMSMPEDDDENEAPEYENEDEEGESGKMIGRTPRSPEILMNTLRGDMRSPSARRKELADLVGEEAAMETPEEVLTLLQSKLGQGIASVPGSQNAGPAPGGATPPPLPPSGAGAPPSGPTGLEALGPQLQAAGLTPPAGGAPAPEAPAPAPGAGPTAPGPLNMADGGEVSYERYYAGGGAVEKKNESVTGLESFSKPDREAIKKGMADYSSLYADILGDPKEQQSLDKALMLAQIAQRGFNFAANVSPTGAPLSGSFASRAAGAFGDVPGILLEGTKNQREREQKLKLAAFDAARQDESESRKLMAQYAIAGMRTSKFGKPQVEQFRNKNGDLVEGITTWSNDGSYSTSWRVNGKEVQGPPRDIYKIPTFPTGDQGGATSEGATSGKLFGGSQEGRMREFIINNQDRFFNGELSPKDERAFKSAVSYLSVPKTTTDPETGLTVNYVPDAYVQQVAAQIPGLKPSGGIASLTSPEEGTDMSPSTPAPTLLEDIDTIAEGLGGIKAGASQNALLNPLMGDEEAGVALQRAKLAMDPFINFFESGRGRTSVTVWKDLRERLGAFENPTSFGSLFASKAAVASLGASMDSALNDSIRLYQRILNDDKVHVDDKRRARISLNEAQDLKERLGYDAYIKNKNDESTEVDSEGNPVNKTLNYGVMRRGMQ